MPKRNLGFCGYRWGICPNNALKGAPHECWDIHEPGDKIHVCSNCGATYP